MNRRARAERTVSWSWTAIALAIYAGVATSGIWIASMAQDVRGLFVALERNQTEQDALLDDYSRLLIERSTVSSYQNVDQVAERQLAMRFPATVERVTQ
jgi:cell division protein FtsL